MALEFSIEQKQLTTVFKDYRNDIEIYTEDNDKDKGFYIRLLNRLLENEKITIKDIHPLGSCKDVIKACENDKIERKMIYIIDGDIHLQYKAKNNIPNLYTLDAYCIENYIICPNSISNFAHNHGGGVHSYTDVVKKIDFQTTIETTLRPLINLFFHFSILSECNQPFKLTSIDQYMNIKEKRIDIVKIESEIDKIKKNILSTGTKEVEYDKMLKKRQQKYLTHNNVVLDIVSGKDYLIPFFRNHIKNYLGYEIGLSKEAWKFILAENCNLDRLSGLKEAILTAGPLILQPN